ncbi:hypothetical protein G9A89_001268 [Geosiphon pyriformis]|nr:hypothetical protein G9A89_001268 [Geosiphon pyriformis]
MIPKNFFWKFTFLFLIGLSKIFSTAGNACTDCKGNKNITTVNGFPTDFKSSTSISITSTTAITTAPTSIYTATWTPIPQRPFYCTLNCVRGKHCEIVGYQQLCVNNNPYPYDEPKPKPFCADYECFEPHPSPQTFHGL